MAKKNAGKFQVKAVQFELDGLEGNAKRLETALNEMTRKGYKTRVVHTNQDGALLVLKKKIK